MLMIVYVIMQGEYSERHIVTVTLDKEKAEKLAKYHSNLDGEAWVDEFETDETPNEKLNRMVPVYYVAIKIDGSSTVKIASYWDREIPYEPRFNVTSDRNMIFTAYLTAPDEAHALKIARDRRAKMLSELLGL